MHALPRKQQHELDQKLARLRTDTVLAAILGDSLTVTFSSESSRAVPRLRYVVGFWSPKGALDVGSHVIAGDIAPRAKVLHSVPDWVALVSATGWFPRTIPNVAAACGEIIRFAAPEYTDSQNVDPPIIYQDDSTLSGPAGRSMKTFERYVLRAHLSPPSATVVNATKAVSTVWAIESYRTIKYECTFDGSGRLHVMLRRVDSVTCAGRFGGICQNDRLPR